MEYVFLYQGNQQKSLGTNYYNYFMILFKSYTIAIKTVKTCYKKGIIRGKQNQTFVMSYGHVWPF